MLAVFIGAISTAILAACVAFIINRLTGVNARWLIPVSAGAAMLGFTIWFDYTWFARTAETLPPSMMVTDSFTSTRGLQPWTLLVAPVVRFRAVDLETVSSRVDQDHVRRAQVALFDRFNATFVIWQFFDCASARRADAVMMGEDGLPPSAAWSHVSPDDPLLGAVCGAPIMG